MANYDFQTILSPLDFEHLVRDLLSKELQLELTSFSEGKDSGTDLRYSKDLEDNIVIQCKRVKNISKAQITNELTNVKKLKPKKYYFVISNNISPEKYNFIKETFKDWMDGDENIYTRDKLNLLIDKHKDVHQKHYKLWLNSSTIFNELINVPLYERAKSLISDLKKDYKFYVRNESLTKAFEILNDNKFIVISGIPGIGKTTLAKLILWEYLQQDFEIIEIRKVIEGEQILTENSERNQVFYYDDFLGENFLQFDVIEGRSNDLIQLIKRIKNSKNKILIMTTREYILNQAKEVYEKLDSKDLNIGKHTLDLSSYSKRIKSHILYNHLYYSNISIDYIKAILQNKTYKEIINHKNYSPRIIEQLTNNLSDILPEKYAKEFIYNLDHPFGIWNKAFNSSIKEGSKFVLYLLLSIQNPILLSDLKFALNHFYKTVGISNNINFKPHDFRNYLRELENSFIKIELTDKKNHFVAFLNPSIKDFLLTIVKEDIEIIKLLIQSSYYFEQFIYTIRYLSSNYLNNKEIQESIDKIIINQFDTFSNPIKVYNSQKEKISKISDIEKLNSLKFYLQQSKVPETREFFFQKFNSIELKNMSYLEERKYLEFYAEFHDSVSIDFIQTLKQVIENISWYDSVENLSILREIDAGLFDSYLNENHEEVTEKVKDSIVREIEFNETEDSLRDFKSTFEIDSNLEIFSISYSEFESYFDEQETRIQEKIEEKEDEELDIKIESVVQTEIENYNEDNLFRIEMFD